ncbi:MAG: SpoIIE family protein phosphatase [Phycisphaerales bacterium]|nr:SpoIIE family protein phosphatase [Phycisphaerales bacterium]
MISEPRILLFDAASDRGGLFATRLSERGVSIRRLAISKSPSPNDLRRADVAVIVPAADTEPSAELIEALAARRIAALIWGQAKPQGGDTSWISHVPADTPLDEIIGRLDTLTRYAPIVRRLDRDLREVERVGRQLSRHFDQMDQEMRMAGRLQRDLLPAKLPIRSSLRFAQLYRPATWVSGDFYDIFDIDETTIGVFQGDAMGHGAAAALITMFLRQAMEPVREVDGTRTIVPPQQVLEKMHNALARQDLPNAQFVTACYAVVNAATRQMALARGGHPHPIRIAPNGAMSVIEVDGGLMGLSEIDPGIESRTVSLEPGEKVVFFTDGIEDLLIDKNAESPSGAPVFTSLMQEWALLSADRIVEAVDRYLDGSEGSLNPEDDVTILVLEFLP